MSRLRGRGVETVIARKVLAEELECLEEAAASLGDGSSVGAALVALATNVRAGADVVVAAKSETITPSKAATILGMSRAHLYKVMDAGDLPFARVGRDRRILLSDLADFSKRRNEDRAGLAERFAHAAADRAALVRAAAGVDPVTAEKLGF